MARLDDFDFGASECGSGPAFTPTCRWSLPLWSFDTMTGWELRHRCPERAEMCDPFRSLPALGSASQICCSLPTVGVPDKRWLIGTATIDPSAMSEGDRSTTPLPW